MQSAANQDAKMSSADDCQNQMQYSDDELFKSVTPQGTSKPDNSNPMPPSDGVPTSLFTSPSLLQEGTFHSRLDKELEIGLEVRKQITEKIYKGHMRAIACTWVH